eukprot:TRINITY_DN6378_c0_g2_i1.p1 TRINITY_DN6378_c0_g2~~TRINITY_DN6378_c0_g2_i1.p1  ORF type:complete len:358 (+),score=90.86 TRINITY_DN6378_c0_g2_i1:67-1074(+)
MGCAGSRDDDGASSCLSPASETRGAAHVLEQQRRYACREGMRGCRRIHAAKQREMRVSTFRRWRRWARHRSKPALRVLLGYALGVNRLLHPERELSIAGTAADGNYVRIDGGRQAWVCRQLGTVLFGRDSGWQVSAAACSDPFSEAHTAAICTSLDRAAAPHDAAWPCGVVVEPRTPLFPYNVVCVISSFLPCACDSCEFPAPQSPGGGAVVMHAVTGDDTFENLALRYGTSAADIRQENRLLGVDCLSYVPLGTPLRINSSQEAAKLSPGLTGSELHHVACQELLRLCPRMQGLREARVYLPEGSTDIRAALQEYYDDMRWEEQAARERRGGRA